MAKVQADVDTKEPLKMKRKPGRPKKLSSKNEPTKINLKKRRRCRFKAKHSRRG